MILYEKRGLGDGSRVGLSRGRVGTAWQPSLPRVGLACLVVGLALRANLACLSYPLPVPPPPLPLKSVLCTLYSVICTPLGQHAVLTLPDTGGASPCREVGLALRANLACLSIPLPVPPPPLPLKSVLCNL